MSDCGEAQEVVVRTTVATEVVLAVAASLLLWTMTSVEQDGVGVLCDT